MTALSWCTYFSLLSHLYMDPVPCRQSFCLKEGPMVIEAKALSLVTATQPGVDALVHPLLPQPFPLTGRTETTIWASNWSNHLCCSPSFTCSVLLPELCNDSWHVQGFPWQFHWCLHGWAARGIVRELDKLCQSLSEIQEATKWQAARLHKHQLRSASGCLHPPPENNSSDCHPPFLCWFSLRYHYCCLPDWRSSSSSPVPKALHLFSNCRTAEREAALLCCQK